MKDSFNPTHGDFNTIRSANVGDIIVMDGKRWRVDKKTSNNAVVRRYRWYHALYDKYIKG